MKSRGNCWADLNEVLLDKIFAVVCSLLSGPNDVDAPFQLNGNLPLVCRRFNACYQSSPTLWRRVSLDWATAINPPRRDSRLSSRAEERNTPCSYSSDNGDGEVPRFGYVCRWLLKRAPLIEHLTLANCHVLGPALEIQLLPLCSRASRLVSLQLLDYTGSGDEVLAALSSSSSSTLRFMKLTCYQPSRGHTVPLRVSTNALQNLVNDLQSVDSVDLEIDSLVNGSMGSKEAQMINNNNFYWSKLKKLISFRLFGRMESVVLHPEMLSSLKNLQNLELVNVRLPQFSPAMVAALSNVSYLSLTNVLAAKPRRKSGFTLWNALPGLKSLKKLTLIGAGRDAELPQSALACSALESLSIQECSNLGDWPFITTEITNTKTENNFSAVKTLRHLSLIDIGLSELPSVHFWRSCRNVTSLTWRNVHQAAPRHRYWDHDGAYALTTAMEPVLRLLRVLRLEFSGMTEGQLRATAVMLHSATKLKELSLQGNRLGGVYGTAIVNAIVHDKLELERISLVNCGLQRVPSAIFSVSSLTELDLSNNPRVETSEEEHKKLKKIKVVKRNDRHAVLAAALPTFLDGQGGEAIALGV